MFTPVNILGTCCCEMYRISSRMSRDGPMVVRQSSVQQWTVRTMRSQRLFLFGRGTLGGARTLVRTPYPGVQVIHCVGNAKRAEWTQLWRPGEVDDFKLHQSGMSCGVSLPARRQALPFRYSSARTSLCRCAQRDLRDQAVARFRVLLAVRRLLPQVLPSIFGTRRTFRHTDSDSVPGLSSCVA